MDLPKPKSLLGWGVLAAVTAVVKERYTDLTWGDVARAHYNTLCRGKTGECLRHLPPLIFGYTLIVYRGCAPSGRFRL